MSPRRRTIAFGSAATLAVAGIVAWIVVGGLTGEVLAIVMIGLGLGAVLLLVFFEIGMSEERAVAEEERERRGRRRLRGP